jgi:hypothetical protein
MIGSTSVGTSSTLVLDANPLRRRVTFQNVSANDIYLGQGESAQTSKGIWLKANVGSATDSRDGLGYIWQGSWYAIAGGAASTLLWSEEY